MSSAGEGFVPNPVLAGLLGICPLAVAARSLAEGAAYGLGAAICAVILGAILPPAKAVVPERLQAPASLVMSAALALAYGLCLRLYSPTIAAGLWIYIPLLTVSGLSLAAIRRLSIPDRSLSEGGRSLPALVLESLAFLLTAAFVGAAREIIGLGTLTLPTPGLVPARLEALDFAPLRILASPAGGFVALGFLVAGYRALAKRSPGIKP
jgi:Na+-translocating ferredoxin:NAD+ oxidoreductase subunit E